MYDTDELEQCEVCGAEPNILYRRVEGESVLYLCVDCFRQTMKKGEA